MTTITIASGNWFPDRHLEVDGKTKLNELGFIEAFIDKYFSQGNKAQAIKAYNALIEPRASGREREQQLNTLQSLIKPEHRNLIEGGLNKHNIGVFELKIDGREMVFDNDLSLLLCMLSSLKKIEPLQEITGQKLKNQFNELTTGAGELRSLGVLTSFFNPELAARPGMGINIFKEHPELAKIGEDALKSKIEGVELTKWGHPQGPVAEYVKNASQEECDAAAAQIREKGKQLIEVAATLAQTYFSDPYAVEKFQQDIERLSLPLPKADFDAKKVAVLV